MKQFLERWLSDVEMGLCDISGITDIRELNVYVYKNPSNDINIAAQQQLQQRLESTLQRQKPSGPWPTITITLSSEWLQGEN